MEKLKVLVVGSGGREHALAWEISQSPLVEKVYCAPGSDGIAQAPKTDCLRLLTPLAIFAEEKKIDFTVVGPEAPLAKGIVNEFEARGLKIVGPKAEATLLESNKSWAKDFMEKYGIPTPNFNYFSEDKIERAKRYAAVNLPCVVKANGLAAGKGVFICHTKEAAESAIDRIMVKKELGEAGDLIVVEEFLKGEEATFMVLTDGKEAMPLLVTQDHKALNDDDEGPNTGGMGAYAPAPVITEELEKEIMDTIIYPTLLGMEEEKYLYKGILYAGLMITASGPKVLEFNCRFGDPELQPIAMLMESDIVPFFMGIAEGKLPTEKILFSQEAAVCVVMTSEGYGYPGRLKIGDEIRGLESIYGLKDVIAFHAGTKLDENGVWKTAGGRVLDITAKGKDIKSAIKKAYEAVSLVTWRGEHHRTDIGKKALLRGYQTRF